jgi:hypothetical protein
MEKPYLEHMAVFTNIPRLGIPHDVSEEIDDLFARQALGGDNSFVRETPDCLDEEGYHKTAIFIRAHGIKDDEFVLIENPQ